MSRASGVKRNRHLNLQVRGGKPVKTYKVALGAESIGPTQRQGDHNPPEGIYTIDSKIAQSEFHRALHVSYPNAADRERARKMGVSPGGDVPRFGPSGASLRTGLESQQLPPHNPEIPSGYSGASTPSRFAGPTRSAGKIRSKPVNPVQKDRLMKHRIIRAFALFALVLALAFPVAVPAAPPAPHAQPTPAAAAAAAEKHHHIHDASDALRAAHADLMEASHDFGGHREDAIRAIDASIHQLEICLQYDR